jgi:hypothetical protein
MSTLIMSNRFPSNVSFPYSRETTSTEHTFRGTLKRSRWELRDFDAASPRQESIASLSDLS